MKYDIIGIFGIKSHALRESMFVPKFQLESIPPEAKLHPKFVAISVGLVASLACVDRHLSGASGKSLALPNYESAKADEPIKYIRRFSNTSRIGLILFRLGHRASTPPRRYTPY